MPIPGGTHARVDENQKEIVRKIRKNYPEATVHCTHEVGDGFPDTVVGYRGFNFILEIKNPEQPPYKRKLQGKEKDFHRDWKGQVDVVEFFEDFVEILTKKFGGRA